MDAIDLGRPGVGHLLQLRRDRNFSGVLPLGSLRAPFWWVGLTEMDEVQFTAPDRSDRRAEWTANLTQFVVLNFPFSQEVQRRILSKASDPRESK